MKSPARLWGLLGGGGLGFALGGPLGALIGALAGHALVDYEGIGLGPAPRQLIFTTGLVALAAKMARSDGVVTGDEVAAFRRLLDVRTEDMQQIEKLFDLAKQTTDGFEAYAMQIANAFDDDVLMREDLLDGLFSIAAADGAIHEAEETYLARVAQLLNLAPGRFEAIEARHVFRHDDPYVVLGVTRIMDTPTIRKRYLALVAEHHPDRQFARGLPESAIKLANRQLAVFNAAWDRIETERKTAAASVGRATA